jgi:hypothetical protein
MRLLLLSVQLRDDAAHVPMLRRMSRDALCTSGVERRDVEDLEVLVAELATNAIRHARAPSFLVDLEPGSFSYLAAKEFQSQSRLRREQAPSRRHVPQAR